MKKVIVTSWFQLRRLFHIFHIQYWSVQQQATSYQTNLVEKRIFASKM